MSSSALEESIAVCFRDEAQQVYSHRILTRRWDNISRKDIGVCDPSRRRGTASSTDIGGTLAVGAGVEHISHGLVADKASKGRPFREIALAFEGIRHGHHVTGETAN